MAATRPYFCTFRGDDHIIEASSAAVAVQHIVGADVTVLRAARPQEVSAWARAGKDIPVASDKVLVTLPPATAAVADATMPEVSKGFDGTAALIWLLAGVEGDRSREIVTTHWSQARAAGRLSLSEFDSIREIVPDFAAALCAAPEGQPNHPVDALRAAMEDDGMDFSNVVDLVHAFTARNWSDNEERMVGETGHLDA